MEKLIYSLALLLITSGCGAKLNPPPPEKSEDITEQVMTSSDGKYIAECDSLTRLFHTCPENTLVIDSKTKTLQFHFPQSYYQFETVETVSSCKKDEKDCYCDEHGCEKVFDVNGKCELTVVAEVLKVQQVTRPYASVPQSKLHLRIISKDMNFLDDRIKDINVRKDFHLYADNTFERAKAKCRKASFSAVDELQEMSLYEYTEHSISLEKYRFLKIK